VAPHRRDSDDVLPGIVLHAVHDRGEKSIYGTFQSGQVADDKLLALLLRNGRQGNFAGKLSQQLRVSRAGLFELGAEAQLEPFMDLLVWAALVEGFESPVSDASRAAILIPQNPVQCYSRRCVCS